MHIQCPYRFDETHVVSFLRMLQVNEAAPEVVIDFANVSFVDPFPTIVIACALKQFISFREHHKRLTTFVGVEHAVGAIGYLKHLGFFRYIGLDLGKAPDEAPGGATYLPFTTIRSSQIMWKGQVMQKEIDRQGERLAKIIFPEHENAGPAMMLAYCLREIMRNSFEHGGVDRCVAMAQRWNGGVAEIALADEGAGIFNTLSRTNGYKSAQEAVQSALLPGVTAGSVSGQGEWSNSGFGLYVVSELGKRFGGFSILSSQHMLSVGPTASTNLVAPVHGTMVKLRVSTEDADYFPNILQQIVSAGEEIAKELPNAVKSASRMSKTPLVIK